jgi:hypothetical protein
MAGDVGRARLDPSAMLYLIAADDLNLHDWHGHPLRDGPPLVARERPRVHAVGDNRVAGTEIVGSHRMRNGVTLTRHDCPGVPERLFD